MPSLPRIRRTRPRGFAEAVAPRPEPRVAELSADGLTYTFKLRPGLSVV